MITVTSYAIGEKYVQELDELRKSVEATSLYVDGVYGVGRHQDNIIDLLSSNEDLLLHETLGVPVKAELVCNWNNIGFIKAFWLRYWLIELSRYYERDDILLWLDADARVRKDLAVLEEDMKHADVGMVKFEGEHWLNGTIALRITQENFDWIDRWWNKCKALFRPTHTDWRLNDQIVMRNMMIEGDCPNIIDLGEKYASLPPELVGDKNNPVKVRPRMEDAIIHHWQMSRHIVKGWSWPPPENERYPNG